MTTTISLIERLAQQAPEVEDLASEAMVQLVHIGWDLPAGSAEKYDWFKAANDTANAFGLPDPFGANEADWARPETSDTRPLYQRVEDALPADQVHTAQRILMALQALAVAIQVTPYSDRETARQLAQEYLDAVNVFMFALGLPSRDEYVAEKHPTVSTFNGVDLAHAVLGVEPTQGHNAA